MDEKTLLAKMLTLLYRESQLANRTENSSDLVRTLLKDIKEQEIIIGVTTAGHVITSMKALLLEMCNNPVDYEYQKTDLINQVKLACYEDDKFYDAVKQNIENDLTDGPLKRSILHLKKSINNYFKEKELFTILNNSVNEWKYKRDQISDVNAFISSIVTRLEPLQMNTSIKDPAVMDEIDIGDNTGMSAQFTQIQNVNSGTDGYVLGWQDLNTLAQGRLRPGETIVVSALQHKYKTGFSLSMFMHMALYNRPRTANLGKKPLLLRISLEDSLSGNLQFMYQKLKYDETGEKVDFTKLDPDEVAIYVKQKLQATGFHVKMIRADPTQWNYKSVCNKIIELEAEGYSIEAVMLDYMALIPTTGCINTGPIGSDKRDMLRRFRNFFAAKGIVFITPHQLSTEAKQLIRGGIPEDQFVKEVAEKGYFDGCRTLDQEMDLELYIHLFKSQGKTYLTVQRGKHRLPTIISEEEKYFIIPFPKNLPIPDDLNKAKISFRSLKEAVRAGQVAEQEEEFFI